MQSLNTENTFENASLVCALTFIVSLLATITAFAAGALDYTSLGICFVVPLTALVLSSVAAACSAYLGAVRRIAEQKPLTDAPAPAHELP